MRRLAIIIALVVAIAGAACGAADTSADPPAHEERGVHGDPVGCFIGDPNADAEIELVARAVDGGGLVDLHDGDDVPLIMPPQGGKVILVGVRAKNVSCTLQLNVGLFDLCQVDDDAPQGRVIGREGRPVVLREDADGFGVPDDADAMQNYANVPVCPSFASTRDGDGQPYGLEVRVSELQRDGETAPRTHVVTLAVTPVCAAGDDDCRCECDADFVMSQTRGEQCPTINDDDLPYGVCPA